MNKISVLGVANKILFQWFFVRLTKCSERHISKVDLLEASNLYNEEYGIGYRYKPNDVKTIQWFSIQGWIVPLTGWSNDFKYLGKRPWFKAVTARKEIK